MTYVSNQNCPQCGNTLQGRVLGDYYHMLDCVFCPWQSGPIQFQEPSDEHGRFRARLEKMSGDLLASVKPKILAHMAEMGITR